MGDSIRTYGRGPSPPSERKRSHEHDDGADERRVRRRSDEYSHSEQKHKRRSRSPRPSEYAKHRDYEQDRRHRHLRNVRHLNDDDASSLQHTNSHSRSPTRYRHHDRHPHPTRHVSKASHQCQPPELPYNARLLSRSTDFDAFRPLFARYLDVQKQIDMAMLDEREARGRWKSFVSKWNNGELADGWYRPETFEDVMLDAQGAGNRLKGERRQEPIDRLSVANERQCGYSSGSTQAMHTFKQHDRVRYGRVGADLGSRDTGEEEEDEREKDDDDDDDDDDDYGPTLPPQDDLDCISGISKSLSQTKHGPGIPTLSDLALRRELEASDRDDARSLLRQERKADRTLQKERLDELAPRADPGSQARRLEKRHEVRDANSSFANAKSSNEMPDLPDADLMGGDGGGIEEYKRLRREADRRKTEREVRREEILRAKREEREDRVREYREREAHTVDMLREIAKSRFG
ncbi:hypothetical protein F4803DRAFT_70197 [Xylaria telfairii]|nr:hypothetical protein F4803DRAFT_70197 [Xylaria telfairii]